EDLRERPIDELEGDPGFAEHLNGLRIVDRDGESPIVLVAIANPHRPYPRFIGRGIQNVYVPFRVPDTATKTWADRGTRPGEASESGAGRYIPPRVPATITTWADRGTRLGAEAFELAEGIIEFPAADRTSSSRPR